jgi:N-methylhydantoinase A/acetophenone carboxylase
MNEFVKSSGEATGESSGASISIDIGGTFTDCYLSLNGKTSWGKASTTTDDFSRGFLNALTEASRGLDLNVENLLVGAAMLRYSTTIALNALLQRSGPRLGLLTTRGHEDMLFIGNGRAWGDGLPVREQRRVAQAQMPEGLIPRDMVVGLSERTDMFGQVIRPLDVDEVLAGLQYLVDRGVQGIIVSLLWSSANSEHEQAVKRIINDEYPEVYLGNIPVLLSSEVVPKWREYTRTTTTVLSGYLHGEMTNQLMGIGDRLRDLGFSQPLQMVQNTGGVAKLSRTRVVDTYQSGPVAGLMGSGARARELGVDNVICTDMGGTSFDLGVLVDGSPRFYSVRPVIDRWAVDLPLLEVKSIGTGGGSIAWLNKAFGDRLEVGPASAGSMPGPACYGLGGNRATVTDADVVLGYLNPDNFLGGRMELEADESHRVIRRSIAEPMGISVEQAALAIRRVADEKMGVEIFKEVVLKGFDPRDFVLFAYGGAGPTHCCGYAQALGISRIFLFPESSVFCAYGASMLDVAHIYERSRPMVLFDPSDGYYLDDYAAFNEVIAELEADLKRDMIAEGLDLSEMQLTLELELRYGSSPLTQRIRCQSLRLKDKGDVEALYRDFRSHLMQLSFGVDLPEATVRIETFALNGSIPAGQKLTDGGNMAADSDIADQAATPPFERSVIWDSSLERVSTTVFSIEGLREGDLISGPAIGEARDTTYVIPPGWELSVLKGLVCELRVSGPGEQSEG